MIFQWCFEYDGCWLDFPIFTYTRESIGSWILLILMLLDGVIVFGSIWSITYPLEVFQLVYPFHPFSDPFPPFKGWWFFIILMRLFSYGSCSRVIILSRTILPRIFEVHICLFQWVLGVMTIQLSLDIHHIFSYPKPHGLTWDKGVSFLWCIINLFFQF